MEKYKYCSQCMEKLNPNSENQSIYGLNLENKNQEGRYGDYLYSFCCECALKRRGFYCYSCKIYDNDKKYRCPRWYHIFYHYKCLKNHTEDCTESCMKKRKIYQDL